MEIDENGVNKIAAIIDIGSNEIKMKISQVTKGNISDLEILEYPINIGHEVFSERKISFESIINVSEILNGYVNVLKEYGIVNYKAIATTAMRESENCEFMVDQLKVKSGINVEVIESNYEKTLIYFAIMKKIKQLNLPKDVSTLIAYIGTGSVGLALCRDDKIVFSHSIPIGYIKLRDTFTDIIESDVDVGVLMEEYLDKLLEGIRFWINKNEKLNLIITGAEVDTIFKAINQIENNIELIVKKEQIYSLYEEFNTKDINTLSSEYGISYNKIKCIHSVLAIYMCILKVTKAERINLLKVELSDIMMEQMLIPNARKELEYNIIENALSSARNICKYYNSNEKHCETLENYACTIFDRLKKFHGLNQRRRLLLQIACILHECGSSINPYNSFENVFNTIKNCNIYGLSHEENLIIACIASHNELAVNKYQSELQNKLTTKNKLIISKLTAIFIVSNALDNSEKQKLSQVKVRINKDELIISGESNQNVMLEKWAVDRCNSYFKEIFGLKLRLSIRPENLII